MRVETECHDDRIVVAVDVCVYTEQALNKLADSCLKGLGEVNTCGARQRTRGGGRIGSWSDVPILEGNTASLLMKSCTQAIRCSMYSGAGILVGLLNFPESCQRYSNSSVAFISGQVVGEQNSVIDPYSRFI